MKLLVTGGAGYIGSHLTDALLAQGHSVTVLDNLVTGKELNLESAIATGRCELRIGDIRDAALIDELVGKAEGIYHLAAVVGVKYVTEHPLEMMLVNVEGTAAVLAAAATHRIPILVASSSEVYGDGARLPFREDEPSVIGPTSEPRWGYALAKALDEHLAFAYWKEQGLPTVAVRYFNSYGPRVDQRGYGSVIAKFIDQALKNEELPIFGDGTQSRAFTFVDDTVAGTIKAFTSMLAGPAARGQAFNVGYPHETTVSDLAQQILELTGSRSTTRSVSYADVYGPDFAEPKRRTPDMSKAQRILGFVPQIELGEGLRRTIAWARQAYVTH